MKGEDKRSGMAKLFIRQRLTGGTGRYNQAYKLFNLYKQKYQSNQAPSGGSDIYWWEKGDIYTEAQRCRLLQQNEVSASNDSQKPQIRTRNQTSTWLFQT
jgi:hypothetical protein